MLPCVLQELPFANAAGSSTSPGNSPASSPPNVSVPAEVTSPPGATAEQPSSPAEANKDHQRATKSTGFPEAAFKNSKLQALLAEEVREALALWVDRHCKQVALVRLCSWTECRQQSALFALLARAITICKQLDQQLVTPCPVPPYLLEHQVLQSKQAQLMPMLPCCCCIHSRRMPLSPTMTTLTLIARRRARRVRTAPHQSPPPSCQAAPTPCLQLMMRLQHALVVAAQPLPPLV